MIIYKLSYVLGIIGYAIIMATFFGFNLIFDVKSSVWLDCGLLLLFYGLYYGVLGRDVSEICADKMASHIGVIFKRESSCRVLYDVCVVVLYISGDADEKLGTGRVCRLWKHVAGARKRRRHHRKHVQIEL